MNIKIPEGLMYTEDHEWVEIKKNKAVIGITDYAQQKLGDITFIELPDIGKEVEQSDVIGEIESVKAASDVYSPVSGKVVRVNNQLDNDPGLINSSPYKEGWIVEIEFENEDETEELMIDEEYKTFTEGLE